MVRSCAPHAILRENVAKAEKVRLLMGHADDFKWDSAVRQCRQDGDVKLGRVHLIVHGAEDQAWNEASLNASVWHCIWRSPFVRWKLVHFQ